MANLAIRPRDDEFAMSLVYSDIGRLQGVQQFSTNYSIYAFIGG
jgi:hypothetical protein